LPLDSRRASRPRPDALRGERQRPDPHGYGHGAIIVDERNTISDAAASPVTVASSAWDPQVVIPEDAWDYFEQTARGDDADLVIQRRIRTSGTSAALEQESRRRVHFVAGQLKGSVYYNSYNSPQGGNTGAVLAIAPGADEPVVAVQPGRRCTATHSVNQDGTRLIANGSSNATFNSSRRYDISNPDDFGAPPVLGSYDKSTSSDTENVSGDRFTFGAPFLDGRLYMTHGGSSGGDSNWRAPPDASKFYDVDSPSAAIPMTNWPAHRQRQRRRLPARDRRASAEPAQRRQRQVSPQHEPELRHHSGGQLRQRGYGHERRRLPAELPAERRPQRGRRHGLR
jgi:hypothetical protein